MGEQEVGEAKDEETSEETVHGLCYCHKTQKSNWSLAMGAAPQSKRQNWERECYPPQPQGLLLTVSVAVIDPFLPVLRGGGGLFHNSFFHNGTRILPGSLLQSPRALPDTADNDDYQDEQQEEDNHPGQVFVDVEVLVDVLRTSPGGPVRDTGFLSPRHL